MNHACFVWRRLQWATLCAVLFDIASTVRAQGSELDVHSAYLRIQADLNDSWESAEPSVADVLCAQPTRTGYQDKNSTIRASLLMVPRDASEFFSRKQIPIYAGCQVRIL